MNEAEIKNSIIRFENVWKSYGNHTALKDVSFEIREGEFITVIGSSGCGKTTMLKLINGLLNPDQGAVYINGQDISAIDQIELRRRIGYVIQSIGLFPHLNVKKNITFIPDILKYDKKRSDLIAKKMIKTVGLSEEILERYPAELSGGQQQRVGVARALAASPRILLMDEPFGALDEITRTKLQNEMLNLHQELQLTIVFITHDLREAAKLGERIFCMEKGAIDFDGTPQEMIASFENQHEYVYNGQMLPFENVFFNTDI